MATLPSAQFFFCCRALGTFVVVVVWGFVPLSPTRACDICFLSSREKRSLFFSLQHAAHLHPQKVWREALPLASFFGGVNGQKKKNQECDLWGFESFLFHAQEKRGNKNLPTVFFSCSTFLADRLFPCLFQRALLVRFLQHERALLATSRSREFAQLTCQGAALHQRALAEPR